MNTKRKLTNDFFETHPVFSLEEAVRFLTPAGGKPSAIERLKYHLAAGRLKSLGRELYAVIHPGATTKNVNPDPFLVAEAARLAKHPALLWKIHNVRQEKT